MDRLYIVSINLEEKLGQDRIVAVYTTAKALLRDIHKYQDHALVVIPSNVELEEDSTDSYLIRSDDLTDGTNSWSFDDLPSIDDEDNEDLDPPGNS